MYRIICNSLKNYASDFDNNIEDPRYRQVYFLRLVEDVAEYSRHKAANTWEYQMLSQFLWALRDCERSQQILHELRMLGIHGVSQLSDSDFSETNRIWQMFLKKAYWRD
ncbi:MAG: hypothetical protein FWC89_07680 [Defluviitaleaceae bacterium]|nr:hypothetical protein [Defluviitaleaceae bacterium]